MTWGSREPQHAAALQYVDVAMVAEYEAVGAGAERRARYFDVAADEAVAEAAGQVVDATVFEYDRMFDFAVLDGAVMINRCKRTNVRIDDAGAFANDRRAANGAIDDFGARFDDDFADEA